MGYNDDKRMIQGLILMPDGGSYTPPPIPINPERLDHSNPLASLFGMDTPKDFPRNPVAIPAPATDDAIASALRSSAPDPFRGWIFIGCTFSGNFDQSVFNWASFSDCHFEGTFGRTSFVRCVFDDCQFGYDPGPYDPPYYAALDFADVCFLGARISCCQFYAKDFLRNNFDLTYIVRTGFYVQQADGCTFNDSIRISCVGHNVHFDSGDDYGPAPDRFYNYR